MKQFRRLIFVSILFVSCASANVGNSVFAPVYVTNSARFYILEPSAMSGSVDGVQRMTASFGKNAEPVSFDVYVIADSEMLSMTVFNEFGTTLAELFYDGARIDFASSVFPAGLNPEYIVADFQFCLYDCEKLSAALNASGLDFAVEKTEFGEIRTIQSNGTVVVRILIEPSVIQYENILRGYSYRLESVR